jgi:glycosyltransferase 2 family protein
MKNSSQAWSDDSGPMSRHTPNLRPTSKSWRRWATLALQSGITLGVAAGVGRRIWIEKEKLRNYDLSLVPSWLMVSGACYLVGLAAAAVFWRLAIRDRGGRPGWIQTLLAYYAGHLGKYVPGKALVIVIRTKMVRSPQVGLAAAAMACVHETVLMMATGALVSLVALLLVPIPHREFWLAVSGVLAAGLVLLALPPVVSRLGRLAARPFSGNVAEEEHASRWQSVGSGACLMILGWLLLGLSLLAVLAAMHQLDFVVEKLGLVKAFGLSTALVALAAVGGFVSLTPAGLGTREWILVETLGPVLGTTHSVIAAVVLRIVWIMSEVIATGIFWLADKAGSRNQVKLAD